MRALWLLLTLAACAGAAKANDDFMADIRSFQEGLRWRKYDVAADFVPAEKREKFLDAHDETDTDLRIDDYELMRVKLNDSHETAQVRVKYTWHLDSVGTVHDTVVDQHWEKQGKMWRILASEHQRGEEMPRAAVVSGGPELP
jgi:hypothetical protein